MNERLSFTIDDVELVDENEDSNFAILNLDFFASGQNLHDLYVSEETLMRTKDTIKNCPLVWKYDEILDDVYTHDDEEVPCGFVPETSEIKARKLPDGRTMLSTIAYVWKRYTGKLLNIFQRDGGEKPVSVEMLVYDIEENGEERELLDYRYEGITILGSYVTPAIPSAMASVMSYSEERDEYKKALEEEVSSKSIKLSKSFAEQIKKQKLLTFPYKSKSEMNPALKGITPPITLAQANYIARVADEVGSDGEKNGWAIAIAQFKKTHKVVDGKWVKKENMSSEKKETTMKDLETLLEMYAKEEELTEEEEARVKAHLESMAEEDDAKDDSEDDSETYMGEEEDMAEDSDEDEEDDSEDDSEEETEDMMEDEDDEKDEEDDSEEEMEANLFEYPETFSLEEVSELFSEDVEEIKLAKAEAEKGEKANPSVIMGGMFSKLKLMANKISELSTENEKLNKFKSKVEDEQKAFEVDKTFKQLSEKVVIPEESREEMLAEAEKYSLENLEEWKNWCKAKSFEFAIKENSESDVVKVGMPFPGGKTSKQEKDLWS